MCVCGGLGYRLEGDKLSGGWAGASLLLDGTCKQQRRYAGNVCGMYRRKDGR